MTTNKNSAITYPNTKALYSKSNRPRILLDCDEVITSFLRAVIKEYNEKNGTNFNPAKCDAWDLTKSLGCSITSLYEIFRTPGFFENLPPRKGAIGAIRELIKSTKYDLYVITATSDDDGSELVEKIRWFKQYLPEFNVKRIIACQDKEIIRGDVIIDDKVENLDACAPFMHCILMDSPTNRDCNKYIRLHRMKELPELLDTIFYNDGNGIKTFEKEIAPKILEEQRATNDIDATKKAAAKIKKAGIAKK